MSIRIGQKVRLGGNARLGTVCGWVRGISAGQQNSQEGEVRRFLVCWDDGEESLHAAAELEAEPDR